MSETLHKLRQAHLERRARFAAAAVPDTAPQRVVTREISHLAAPYGKKKEQVPPAPVPPPVVLAAPAPMELPEVQPSSILFINYVQRYIAAHYGFSRETLVGRSRAYSVTHARHVAMYIVETLTRRSRADIGLRFKRDASSVFHATDKMRKQLEHDARLRGEVGTLMAHIVGELKNKGAMP